MFQGVHVGWKLTYEILQLQYRNDGDIVIEFESACNKGQDCRNKPHIGPGKTLDFDRRIR